MANFAAGHWCRGMYVEVQLSMRSHFYMQVCRPPMEVKRKECLSLEMAHK